QLDPPTEGSNIDSPSPTEREKERGSLAI
ncbi:BnaCnng60810D, partial [Brassica napus]